MLSVIIPTYRERQNLEPLLSRLHAVRTSLSEPLEVLIVDGGSDDGTAAHARTLLSPLALGRVIERDGRADLAQAVLHGVREARGDLIGVMDADLSHPPELLAALVRAVRSGSEVAIASRYVRGGRAVGWPWSRRILSRAGNLLARPLVPVRDATSGYFVADAALLRSLTHQARGFKVLLEFLVQARVQRIQEVPYEFIERAHGTSKLSPRVLWLYLRQLGRLYRGRLSPPRPHPAPQQDPSPSLAQWVEQVNGSSSVDAKRLHQQRPLRTPWTLRYQLLIHALTLLWRASIKPSGRRDGADRLIVGVLAAWTHFLTWAKCWAMTLPQPQAPPDRAADQQDGHRISERGRVPLSIVIITRNEEDRIDRCLRSVSWANDIVVVDGMSTDRTVAICKDYGARVISHAFAGSFAEERNLGAAAASNDWVLQLDADDVVSDGLRQAIGCMLTEGTPHAIVKIQRKSNFLGHWMRTGGWDYYYSTLYRRSCYRFEGRVHHVLKGGGTAGVLDAAVLHYPFTSLGQFVARHNRYTSLEAQEMLDEQGVPDRRVLRYHLRRRPVKLFWKSYVKKQGFREGWYGFIFAVLYAWVHFLKWAKYGEAWEHRSHCPSSS